MKEKPYKSYMPLKNKREQYLAFWWWHTSLCWLASISKRDPLSTRHFSSAGFGISAARMAPPTLPGHAVDSLWRDWARWILGLFTIWPTGSCSFFPAKASWENAVWYPGVSSMSMKCSSSGIVSSSGSSKRPMRACSKGVLYANGHKTGLLKIHRDRVSCTRMLECSNHSEPFTAWPLEVFD